MGTVGAENGFFVTFAEDEDEVAFLGEADGFFNGFFAVNDFDDLIVF